MKRRIAFMIVVLVLLAIGCLPIGHPVVDPPEPPVLTMQQRQKLLMDDSKASGFMPRSGGRYVVVEVELDGP